LRLGGPISGAPSDANCIFSFPAGGAYTFRVTDVSGKGGQVLVVAYYNAEVSYVLGIEPD
jgi:hypothetical protein